jgi:hypothetical protein
MDSAGPMLMYILEENTQIHDMFSVGRCEKLIILRALKIVLKV